MIALRTVSAGDAEELFPLVFQSGVTDTLAWDGPTSLPAFQQALSARESTVARGEVFVFTIYDKTNNKAIGSASIRPDAQRFRASVGLWIGKPYQGQDYGTQSVKALVEFGFNELPLQKIDSYIFVGNKASRRIFEKNGFQLEGTVRKAVLKRGKAVDEWLLGITREDWASTRTTTLTHICQRLAWEKAKTLNTYSPLSLEEEGFIHCSRPQQVIRVANRFYHGQKDLVLLWIDLRRVTSPLYWEAADGELFPHFYGPLNIDAVTRVTDFSPDEDGTFHPSELG